MPTHVRLKRKQATKTGQTLSPDDWSERRRSPTGRRPRSRHRGRSACARAVDRAAAVGYIHARWWPRPDEKILTAPKWSRSA